MVWPFDKNPPLNLIDKGLLVINGKLVKKLFPETFQSFPEPKSTLMKATDALDN